MGLGDLIRQVLPWPLKKDISLPEREPCNTGPGLSLGLMCSLSIPIITICALILISRLGNTWLLVMPEFDSGTSFWLDVAAVLALGGAMLLLFAFALHALPSIRARVPAWRVDHA